MGMFDWYNPIPSISCPVCKKQLAGWQGKAGPNALFLWKQGYTSPVDQLVDDEIKISAEERAQFHLPDEFEFYTYECDCKRRIVAIGRCTNGTWNESQLMTPDNARPYGHESQHEFRARVQDLAKWLSNAR